LAVGPGKSFSVYVGQGDFENHCSCGSNDGLWNLCSICHTAFRGGSVPKFSAKNNVNVTLCQHYPDALKGLTLTEEYFIAKSHPVGVIEKLPTPRGSNVASKLFAIFATVVSQPFPKRLGINASSDFA
jgi:hypothetical protein